MTSKTTNELFINNFLTPKRSFPRAPSNLGIQPLLDFAHLPSIIHVNNTPPASLLAFGLECSAPRGVTRFWGAEK